MGVWSLFKGRRQTSAGSGNETVDLEKARKILEEYDYSFHEMDKVKGVYEEYKQCHVPMETVRQWHREAFEKRKEEFRQSCENGTPDFKKLDFVVHCTNSLNNKNIIRDSYDVVRDYAEKIGFANEIICYFIISDCLSFQGIASTVGPEDFQYVLGGIKERLDHIFQTDAQLQEKYQRMYTGCESALAAIDQYFPVKQ